MSGPVSQLTAWVVLPDGSVASVVSVSVTMDEAWSPHVQAEATIPATPDALALLDPRVSPPPRVRIGVRRAWHGAPTLGDLSTEWVGLTLGDLSTEWVGLTLGDLTAGWTVDWGSGDRPADELVCDLTVRSLRHDHAAGTITLRAASDELLAQRAAPVPARPEEPLPDRISAVLGGAGVQVVAAELSAGVAVMAPALPAADWSQSPWAYLSSLAASAGLRLWCDHTRTWRLTDPANPPANRPQIHMERVTAVEDTIDADGGWADVLAVTCTWTTYAGDQVTETRTWPANPTPGLHTVHHLAVTIPADQPSIEWPGPSDVELGGRLAALTIRGKARTLVGPADPTVLPGGLALFGPPSLPLGSRLITAVAFEVPADTMTVTTRIA